VPRPPPALIDSVNNKWVKVGDTGGYRRARMNNIYRVQVRGKAGTGKTCCASVDNNEPYVCHA
jgi:hypothetical protein